MHTMTDMERGAAMQALRKNARLTQREVGAHFGIDKGAVSEWETGRSRPTVDKLAELDSLYGADGGVLRLYGVGATANAAVDMMATIVEAIDAATLRVTRVLESIDRRLRRLEVAAGLRHPPRPAPNGAVSPGSPANG